MGNIGNQTNVKAAVGYLTWWTLHTRKDYPVAGLVGAAQSLGVPAWMVDRITGKDALSAWKNATQLSATGVPATLLPGETKGVKARYLTKLAGGSTRAIVREVIDVNNIRVATSQVATLVYGGVATKWDTEAGLHPITLAEVEGLFKTMQTSMAAQIGNTDDARLRLLILDWLERKHRVTLRGSGGVYFLPRRTQPAYNDELERELLAIKGFITSPDVGGSFSIAELTPGGATTFDEFVKSAVDELKAEISAANAKLTGYLNSANMNDGSRAVSAQSVVQNLAELEERKTVLVESLGTEIDTISAMLDIARKRAARVVCDAHANVDAFRAGKAQTKLVIKPAAPTGGMIVDAPEGEKGEENEGSKKQGKRGTAQARAEHVVFS